MTDTMSAPFEVAVIEFPGSQFNGEVAPALADLVDGGLVTIVDLVFLTKDGNGTLTTVEFSDLDEQLSAAFDAVDGEINGLLTTDDLRIIGESMAPGSSALIVLWENTWARPLAAAVRGSGGRMVAHSRLDADAVREMIAAVE